MHRVALWCNQLSQLLQEFKLDVFGGWQFFRPKGGEVFLKEFQGGPEIDFLRILVAKSIKKGGQNGAFLKHFLQEPVS